MWKPGLGKDWKGLGGKGNPMMMLPQADWQKEVKVEKWKTSGWQDWGYDDSEIQMLRDKKGEAWNRIASAMAQALMPVGHLEIEWNGPDWQKRMSDKFDHCIEKLA